MNNTPAIKKEELQEFIAMSQALGGKPDVIQAGGGNTSLKSGPWMAVKASGCKLKDMSPEKGYALLPYEKVREIYRNSSSRGPESEAETSAAVRALAASLPGLQAGRPSVEAGFHALLGKAVAHSHSVYANILACSNEGGRLLRELFGKEAVLPFINPGAELCFAFADLTPQTQGTLFLENHGLVTWAEDTGTCLTLHKGAQEKIKEACRLPAYPAATPVLKAATGYASQNPFLEQQRGWLTAELLLETPLIPDQLVYLNTALEEGKVLFSDVIRYNASEEESGTLEEVLLSVAYILYCQLQLGFSHRPMPPEGIAFIKGWDAEKYRRSLQK